MNAIPAVCGYTNKLFMLTIWETPRKKKVTLGVLFIY